MIVKIGRFVDQNRQELGRSGARQLWAAATLAAGAIRQNHFTNIRPANLGQTKMLCDLVRCCANLRGDRVTSSSVFGMPLSGGGYRNASSTDCASCSHLRSQDNEVIPMSNHRGTVGIIRPTQRMGPYDELLAMLPQGIKLIPLCLDVRRGAVEEFKFAIAAYEDKVAEFARMGVDVINPSGAPPFMVFGYANEQELIRKWRETYNTRVFTSGSSNIDAMRALGVKTIVGATYFRGDINRKPHLCEIFRRCRDRLPRHGRDGCRFRQGAATAERASPSLCRGCVRRNH